MASPSVSSGPTWDIETLSVAIVPDENINEDRVPSKSTTTPTTSIVASSAEPSQANGSPLPSRDPNRTPLPFDEQRAMFSTLEAIFQQAEETEGGVGVSELRTWAEEDDVQTDVTDMSRVESLTRAKDILQQMWLFNSEFMPQAAKVLADASRDREWKMDFVGWPTMGRLMSPQLAGDYHTARRVSWISSLPSYQHRGRATI